MKTRFNFKILFLIILSGLSFSCSKNFLVEFPRLQQSNELTLSTYEGLAKSTIGAYSQLCADGWYGAGFVITADLKGGNAKKGPINSGRYVDEYLWNNTNGSSTSGLWTVAYSTIAKVNNIINVIDGGFSETGITRAQLDQLKGECLFLRALSYFDLARIYCQPYAAGRDNPGVPVVLVTENGYPARKSVGEVYDRAVEDLLVSIPLLSAASQRKDDAAWATKAAANALLAKVYLYMGSWQDAADHATAVIGNTGLSLFTAAGYSTWDNGGYWGSGGPGAEIIFQVDGSSGNTSHGYWEAISFMMSPKGYGDIAASNDLLSLYEAGDVRADLFIQPAAYPGAYWSIKYPGRFGNNLEYNVPVLRLSEMYLIRTEAILNGASVPGVTALADFNTIRTNRGLAAATSVDFAEIYRERRRELCFEGNELFDLARTLRSLVRVDYTGLTNKDITFVAGGSAETNYLWAMPIPQAEMDANVNMVQNPGY